MHVLLVQNVAGEGPGTLGDLWLAEGVRVDCRRMHEGEALPVSPAGYDLLVVLGGPMNVDEGDRYPYLDRLRDLMAEAVERQQAVLGICLGAQLLARALGARVYRAPEREVGWFPVHLSPAGLADPVLAGLPPQPTVFQWHGDTFDLPAGAVLLAEGEICRHQAFRTGRAYGLQFHPEVDGEMVERWLAEAVAAGEIGPEAARHASRAAKRHLPELQALTRRLWRNLRQVIAEGP